jgi:hypothetical protein
MTPSDMLEKLKQDATPRTIATLEAIFEICIEQQERGVKDFSIATIAKLGLKRGVPREQSLRNNTGECYRALIKAFADLNDTGVKDRPEARSKEDWIEEISNPKHKLLARIQAAELAAAQSKIRGFVPPGTRIDVFDHRGSHDDPDVKLTLQELNGGHLNTLFPKNSSKSRIFPRRVTGNWLTLTTKWYSKLQLLTL